MRKNAPLKTLLVGCGRIGAGWGTKGQRRESHAAVLSRLRYFDVTLFDPNCKLAQDAARILRLSSVDRIESGLLGNFNCAVICAPSPTHFEYLSTFMRAGVPLIVCEKPLCVSAGEVRKLQRLRQKCGSKVVVNYTRRFLPSYANLRRELSRMLAKGPLRAIAVRYQRGFLNNASHAIDLVQFLTGWDVRQARAQVVESVKDEFPDDPTLTCQARWNGASLSIVGLPSVRFSLFEIDFFFDRDAVRLRDRGDTIELAVSAEPEGYYAPLKAKKVTRGHLRSPLEHLYRHVRRISRDPRLGDNFEASLALAKWSFGMLGQK